MASSVVLRRHISDITQCPICLDVFDRPTSLPCLHTFCLPCLQSTFSADYPGDVATCPVCRRDFQLPEGGLSALPRNFTVDGLIEMCTATRPVSAPAWVDVTESVESASESCETVGPGAQCTEETKPNRDEIGISAAAASSGDCAKCSLSPTHQSITALAENLTTLTMNCDKHGASEEAEFCFDCREDVCVACSGDVHSCHRRRKLIQVTAECRRRVAGELARLTDALRATHVSLLDVDRRRTNVLEQLQQQEGLARKECCAEDNSEAEERLRALLAEKDDTLRQLAARKELLDVDKMSLETFLNDSTRKLKTATTAGLLRIVKEVKTGVDSLLRLHQKRMDLSSVDAKQQTLCAELVTTLAEENSKPVSALTTLADELYVARAASNVIDVFDVESFSLLRRLTIDNVKRGLLTVVLFGHASGFNISDMTSCRLHGCLYVADGCSGVVRRLDHSTAKQVTEWSVGSPSLVGLSVTGTFNVLAFCSDSPAVRMYTPLGCTVFQVDIQRPDLVGLLHGVQLDCGWFVVIGLTQSGSRLVCLYRNGVDMPDLIHSSDCVTYVALAAGAGDGSGVWLAERGANAGVRMVRVLASRYPDKLSTVDVEEPDKMCWDENSKRLYVLDNGRVRVFRVQVNGIGKEFTLT